MKRKGWRAGAVLTGALLFAGCGDLTAGGVGEIEVFASADDPGPSPSPVELDGLLAAEMQVYLQSDASAEWVEITDGVRDLTLDLKGDLERRVAVRFVDAGRYTRLRVIFRRVEATVSGGLIVEGQPLTGQVSVDLGAQSSLTVEREMLLEVERDQGSDVVLDLNVDVWLPTVSAATRTVPAAALQDALSVRVR